MAAAPLSAEPIELECPVCHEEFTEPKILPCAHILCQACLVTWLDSDMEALCPMCRSTIVDTNERFTKSAQVLAEALPTDLAMAAVVKSSAILRENQVCCVCPNVAATSFCLDCNDMLCQACAVAHGKLRVLRHHKLENLTSLTARGLAAKGSAECVAHPHQICSLYCISHGDSICHTCATTKHRSCAEVVEVEDKVKEAQTKLDELLATLKQGEANFEQAASELDQKLQQVEEASQEDIEEVEKMHGDLKNVLEERCQQIKEMIQKSGSDTKALVCSEKTTIAAKQGKLTSHRRLVERAKESTPSTDLGSMTKLLQLRVKDLDFSLPESQISMRRLRIDSQAVSQIKEAFEKLGQLLDISNRAEACEPDTWENAISEVLDIQTSANKTGIKEARSPLLPPDLTKSEFFLGTSSKEEVPSPLEAPEAKALEILDKMIPAGIPLAPQSWYTFATASVPPWLPQGCYTDTTASDLLRLPQGCYTDNSAPDLSQWPYLLLKDHILPSPHDFMLGKQCSQVPDSRKKP